MIRDRFVIDFDSSGLVKDLVNCRPGEPGVYTAKVKQTPEEKFETVYAFVGKRPSESYLKNFRKMRRLGENWGVVTIHYDSLKDTSLEPQEGLGGQAVMGILLEESQREKARGLLLEEHEVVFLPFKNYPSLRLQGLDLSKGPEGWRYELKKEF